MGKKQKGSSSRRPASILYKTMNNQKVSQIRKKNIKQRMGKFYTFFMASCLSILFLLVRYCIVSWHADFITLNSLSSSIIASTTFIIGFLLSGIFTDYKEVDKIPSEMRSLLESILSEGNALERKDPDFNKNNSNLKDIILRFIKEFEDGLSDTKDHSHIAHAFKEIKNFDEIFDDMERRGVPPNYMTRIKTEQSNLKKILLRVYHIQKTKFVPSVVLLVDSMIVLVVVLLLFIKTDFYIGFIQLAIISYILLYSRKLIIILEKPFRKGADDTEDDVSIFVLRELKHELENKK